MKIEVRKKGSRENEEIEVRSIYVYDKVGNQFEVELNKFGELEIRKTDGAIIIEPHVSNEIAIK